MVRTTDGGSMGKLELRVGAFYLPWHLNLKMSDTCQTSEVVRLAPNVLDDRVTQVITPVNAKNVCLCSFLRFVLCPSTPNPHGAMQRGHPDPPWLQHHGYSTSSGQLLRSFKTLLAPRHSHSTATSYS